MQQENDMNEDRLRVDLRETVRVLRKVQDYLDDVLLALDGPPPARRAVALRVEVTAAIEAAGG